MCDRIITEEYIGRVILESINEIILENKIRELVREILEEGQWICNGKEVTVEMLKLSDIINPTRLSRHFENDRRERWNTINKRAHNDIGDPKYAFKVDRGDLMGEEIHIITEKAIIIVISVRTGKVVTVFPASPGGIYRYWATMGVKVPLNDLKTILRYAKINKSLDKK